MPPLRVRITPVVDKTSENERKGSNSPISLSPLKTPSETETKVDSKRTSRPTPYDDAPHALPDACEPPVLPEPALGL